MMKKLTACVLALTMFILCGCGMYDKEYYSESVYAPPAQGNQTHNNRVVVKNLSALKAAILDMVEKGKIGGNITFDSTYDGNCSDDLALACWQIRSQDALCAYCVDNISYELSKIVTYYEASVHISYISSDRQSTNIIKLPYSAGAEDIIRSSLTEGSNKVVFLINRSSLNASDMESLVLSVYKQHPITAPKEPNVNVRMYSGTGMQRLYDVSIKYGYSTDTLAERKAELSAVNPFSRLDIDALTQGDLAKVACEYLVSNCSYIKDGEGNIYSALCNNEGNSEGIALAYVALCNMLSVDCQMVYGQQQWEDHCWNIVQIDGNSFHVDVSSCIQNGMDYGFLCTDSTFWSNYRWDVASYPSCQTGIDEVIFSEIDDSSRVPSK